jgi:hypothetical protein
MAGPAVGIPQHGAAWLRRFHGLRRNNGSRLALDTFRSVAAILAIIALAARLLATHLVTLGAGSVIARPIIPGTILTGSVITRAIITIAVAIPVAVAVAAKAFTVAGPVVPRSVVTRTVVAGTVVTVAVLTGAIIPWAILTRLPFAAVTRAGLIADIAIFSGFAGGGGGLISGQRLSLTGLILKIDVIAGREVVPTKNLACRPVRLDGAQEAEIVLGVLKVVFSQDPVAGCVGVSRQLLVFFEDVLRVAPHLHALGTVGIKGPVGVLRGLHVAPAAAAAPIAPTLALHTLEISHILKTVRLFPERQFGGLAFSLASVLPDQIVEDVCVPRLPPWSSSARGLF